jgi:hypothetical protein
MLRSGQQILARQGIDFIPERQQVVEFQVIRRDIHQRCRDAFVAFQLQRQMPGEI